MPVDAAPVDAIVEEVIRRLGVQGAPSAEAAARAAATPAVAAAPARAAAAPAPEDRAGVFETVEEAVEAARRAGEELASLPLMTRQRAIDAIRAALGEEVERLSRMAVEETGLGRVEDKIEKNLCVVRLTPGTEVLEPRAVTGDGGITLTEWAPFGLVAAITPMTNPSETVINNGISLLAAGNTAVFNPHPAARQVSIAAISVMNRAVLSAGGPANCFTSAAAPTIETAQALFAHPAVRLLVVTGGQAVVNEARRHGKRVIGAGPGNPPVVVDETADLERAGRDIVRGASLDNNIVCSDEKEVFALSSIADELKRWMVHAGAVELTPWQGELLARMIFKERRPAPEPSEVDRAFTGLDAAEIMRRIDQPCPPEARLLLLETEADHPLVWSEQLMPVLPLVRTPGAEKAIELAVAAERGNRHTAVMHSTNVDRMTAMARAMDTCIFVKNGPSYAGLGQGGEGHTSYTIATQTGEGLTTARTFSRERRCSLIGGFRIV